MNGSIRVRTKRLDQSSRRKEAYRLFWIVKGHFNATEQCILDCYDSYFKRVWYNEEAYIYEEGFEEAYKATLNKTKEVKD